MKKQIENKLAEETGVTSQWSELSDAQCPYCGDSNSLYILDDNRSVFCLRCNEDSFMINGELTTDEPEESDYLSNEFEQANKAASMLVDSTKDGKTETTETKQWLPGFTPKAGSTGSGSIGGSTGSGYTSYISAKPSCTHYPTHVIAGRGWDVYAGKKWDVKDQANRFDVVLNLQFDSIRQQRIIPIPELQKWEQYQQSFQEIQINWPDYGVSDLPREFWQDLVDYLRTNKKRMLVFCIGGHGRTGTAIACLMVVSLGWSAKRAIAWVRKNYCSEAIETTGQSKYVEAIAKAGRKQKAAKGN